MTHKLFKECPSNFIQVYEDLKNKNQLNFLSLINYYSTSSVIIHRWLNECGLSLDSKYANKRISIVDEKSLYNDIISCNYNISQLKNKYNIKYIHLENFCKKNNLDFKDYLNLTYLENIKYIFEFSKYVKKYGKKKAAENYNTTLATIIGICKRNNINVIPYKGLILDDTLDMELLKVDLNNNDISDKYICQKHCINPLTIKRLCKKYKIARTNVFEKEKQKRENILEIIDIIIDENHNQKMTLVDISKKHKISIEQLKRVLRENDIEVYNHGYNESSGEQDLKKYIQSLVPNEECRKIRKNFNNKKFEIDCFVKRYNFGIEYCGEFWHNDVNVPKFYHQEKYIWAKEQDISLMHIFEHEWKYKTEIVKSMIKNKLGLSDSKIFARKCEIKEISSLEAKKFFDDNHLMGGIYAHVNIALVYEDKIISVCSFSKPRFTKDVDYEIIRFATLLNYNIVGGLSKILNYFKKVYNPSSILTYADLRFGDGNAYEKSGFVFQKTTHPNYWYFIKDGYNFESRIKYQKHKLSKLLPTFDVKKTEYENMSMNGYMRIYDCGNNIFLWEK